MSKQESVSNQTEDRGPVGVIGMFDDVDSLVSACRRMRDAGYTKWEAHSSYPIHGLDEAAGIKPTVLPWIVLVCGLTGTACAMLMQWWMNAVDYPYLISGKPFFSIPANIPVAFEMTILFSAFAAFFGMLILNGFPRWSNPLFRVPEFKRVTGDRFAIVVDEKDPNFNPGGTFLKEIGAKSVIPVPADPTSAKFPIWFHVVGSMATLAAIIPIVLIARARVTTSEAPPIHIVPDMDFQWKNKAQTGNSMFADGRAMRKAVEGTIAVGDVVDANLLSWDAGANTMTTPEGVTWRTDNPVAMTDALFETGRDKYMIHCAPCHGGSGYGDGPVAVRQAAKDVGWIPANFHGEEKYKDMPVGQIYSAIAVGVNNNNMMPYASVLNVEERWAVAAYVQALQKSQSGTRADIPQGVEPLEAE